MAFGRRSDEDFETTGTGAAPSTPSAAGGLTAFIDQGSSFEGKLSFKDTVRIDGHFSGEISSENTLVVGESGEIEANIDSQAVIVSGSIAGDVTAGRKVVLHKTARVTGNICTPSIVIEEGALLNGQVSMKAEGKGAPAKAPAKTPLKAVDAAGTGKD